MKYLIGVSYFDETEWTSVHDGGLKGTERGDTLQGRKAHRPRNRPPPARGVICILHSELSVFSGLLLFQPASLRQAFRKLLHRPHRSPDRARLLPWIPVFPPSYLRFCPSVPLRVLLFLCETCEHTQLKVTGFLGFGGGFWFIWHFGVFFVFLNNLKGLSMSCLCYKFKNRDQKNCMV